MSAAHTPTLASVTADFLEEFGSVLARGDDSTRDALTNAERLLRSHDALVAALEVLAAYPLEDFCKETKPDASSLFGANSWQLRVGHVRAARAAIAAAKVQP